MGVKTFGKGSVQTVYPLEGGAGLRLTTALYYTPGGRSIQEVGISPDIPVKSVLLAAAESEMAPHRLRERDLEGHFTHEEVEPGEPEAGEATVASDRSVEGDLQLARALEVLKSWTYFERLKKAGPPAASLQARAPETEP
jgi:carboxyl-terminal processing protease